MPVNITQETFYALTLELSRVLQNTYLGTATGGTGATVITDTNNDQPANYYADSIYQGTVWLPLYGTTHLVTGHTVNNLTISPAAGGNIVAGVVYYAAPPIFPRLALKTAINRALADISKVPTIGTFTAVADQESYTSSDNALFGEEIIKVEIATNLTSPYDYAEHFNWQQEAGRTFRFFPSYVPCDVYPMRITYLGYSAELSADSDEISTFLPPELVVWTAAVNALRWKVQGTKQDDPTHVVMLNEAVARATALLARYRINFPQKVTHSRW
jgi:hypothetical protein